MDAPAAAPLAFIDTETTGLDEAVHEIFEIAVIRRDEHGVDREWNVWLPVDVSKANPQALELNGYELRRAQRAAVGLHDTVPEAAVAELVELTAGVPIVAMNPGFDVRFLTPLLARFGRRAQWHYSPVDCKSLIAGALRIPPPWSSERLARALGVDPDAYERHGALGDCRYVRDCYNRVFNALAAAPAA